MARHSKITGYVTSRVIAGQTMYMVRLNYGPSEETGKRQQPWDDQRFKTEKEAERRLAVLLHEKNAGQRDDPRRRTVGDLLAEWLQHEATGGVRVGTLEDYESICRVHLQPAFGRLQASKLSSAQVERWRHAKLAAGHSRTLVSRCTLHLGQALKYGIRHGYLTYNPVSALRPLRREHQEMQVWSAAEVKRFLATVADHSYSPLWALAVRTGMRKGELAGLRWEDVDLDNAVLHVRRTISWANGKMRKEDTKNRLARTIDLDSELVALLRGHKDTEPARAVRAGEHWQEGGWVCESNVGTPINPYNMTRAMQYLILMAGVKRIRFHDLRHTCASLLLAAGVPVHVVSRQLGHSSPAITLRVYAHLMEGQGALAAETMRKILGNEADI